MARRRQGSIVFSGGIFTEDASAARMGKGQYTLPAPAAQEDWPRA